MFVPACGCACVRVCARVCAYVFVRVCVASHCQTISVTFCSRHGMFGYSFKDICVLPYIGCHGCHKVMFQMSLHFAFIFDAVDVLMCSLGQCDGR